MKWKFGYDVLFLCQKKKVLKLSAFKSTIDSGSYFANIVYKYILYIPISINIYSSGSQQSILYIYELDKKKKKENKKPYLKSQIYKIDFILFFYFLFLLFRAATAAYGSFQAGVKSEL